MCVPFGIIMRLLKKPTRDEAAEKTDARRVAPISACVFSDLFYKSGKKPQWQIALSVIGAKLVFWLQLILHASSR